MKIKIDGIEHTIPADEEYAMLQQIRANMLEEYAKLEAKWRLLGKPVAREILRKMEDQARAKHGHDAALYFRPDKKADPIVFLSGIMAGLLQEALQHVTLAIGVADDHTVTALALSVSGKSVGGGSLVTDGNVGQRQDDGAEIP
jgi:hypothetical protein